MIANSDLGPILTDDHASEREKDDQQEMIKRGRKENLICYMSGPWDKEKAREQEVT